MDRHTTARQNFQVEQTDENQPVKAGERSGVGGRNRRSAPGRKIFNGRGVSRNCGNKGNFNQVLRGGWCYFDAGCVHLALRKDRDGAMVLTAVGIMMQTLMRVGQSCQAVQQQDKTRQQ